MKIQILSVLLLSAALMAQETAPEANAPAAASSDAAQASSSSAAQIPCKTSFDAIKGLYPRDAAADRIYSQVYSRIAELEGVVAKDLNSAQLKLHNEELKNCDAAVELLKSYIENAGLRKKLDSLTQKQIQGQKELSKIQSELIAIWAGRANEANYLAAALSDEKARTERLAKEQAEKDSLEKAKLTDELAKQKADAEAQAAKDSVEKAKLAAELAKQKAEAEKKLLALQSKTINVYKDARGTVLALSDILFETGKADLTLGLKENLAEVSAILKSLLSDSKVVIEGHTDNVGKEDFNRKLSEQRASAVMAYLIERGVNKNNLKSVGYGLTKPIADNNTEVGRAKNRRVELVIQDK